jgi:acyl carrier protein
MSTQTPFEYELAGLIVRCLNLDVTAESIGPDDPIYGEGLGLDSIDILEIALAIAKEYGVQIKAGDAQNVAIFHSLRKLAVYVSEQRVAQAA